MKFSRSSKCYFNKWLTKKKMSEIQELLDEYARVCNYIVEKYQEEIPSSRKEDKDKGPSKYAFCKKERAYDIISKSYDTHYPWSIKDS